MAKKHELPRVIGKPPPYPSSQLSEGTRAYFRKLSKPSIDYDCRGVESNRAGKQFSNFDCVCSCICAIAAFLPRRGKSGTGIVLHAAALAALLVSLSMIASSLMASGHGDGILTIAHSPQSQQHRRVPEKQREDALQVVERILHSQYSIPKDILESLAKTPPAFIQPAGSGDGVHPRDATRLLLTLLTKKTEDRVHLAAIDVHPVSATRALFVTIEARNIGERVRAVASALAYAENTDRVPVIFWGIQAGHWNLSWTDTFANASALDERGVFVDHLVEDITAAELHGAASESGVQAESMIEEGKAESDRDVVTRDWAEFSVLEIGQDAPVLEDAVESGSNGGSTTGAVPIGLAKSKTRDDIRSLDAAAAIDSHVSLTLTDEAVSRYAPRAQAAIQVSNGLLKATQALQAGAATAYAFEYALAEVSEDDVVHRLHESFDVPYLLLRGMRSHMQRLLLQNLVAKQATGTQKPRAIFVNVQYGLGNRLRALGSALAFAHETNRVPVLIWVPDHHLNCQYGDLFVEQDEIAVNDGFDPSETWPYDDLRGQDDASKSVMWYNYMRQNGVHIHDPSELVVDDTEFHIYVSTAYVIQTPVTPYIIRTTSPFWRVLKALTPQVSVARLVERLDQMPLHKMMGVHIRSKLIETDISGIGAEEYSKESSKRTDYWRSLTQVDTFIEEMKRQPPTQLFYIAADNVQALEQLQAEFPSRIYYTPRSCDGRDRECLPYALADVILLSKCTSIRGSYWSSFSEVAVRMGGGRVLLAGIDFGRPEVKTRKTLKSSTTLKRQTPRTKRRPKKL
jgi:hypothetical protein